MTIIEKIKLAMTYKHISESQLAKLFGSTPSAFNQRMKTGKFTSEELEKIANLLGAEFTVTIRFPDGTTF